MLVIVCLQNSPRGLDYLTSMKEDAHPLRAQNLKYEATRSELMRSVFLLDGMQSCHRHIEATQKQPIECVTFQCILFTYAG
jgi:hypothetical protein